MKSNKLREMTPEEMTRMALDVRKELFDIQIKKSKGEAIENPLRIRTLRRELARIETVIKERGI